MVRQTQIDKLANSSMLAVIARICTVLVTILITIIGGLSAWTLGAVVDMKEKVAGINGALPGYEARITTLENATFGSSKGIVYPMQQPMPRKSSYEIN